MVRLMKLLWCWRCRMEIPMLEEDEYNLVMSKEGIEGTGGGRDRIKERFGPVLREYEQITGFHETNPMAIYHHRLSLCGTPCLVCGKPLRTPKARFCAACGHRHGESNIEGGAESF
jgi:hypothetical protein